MKKIGLAIGIITILACGGSNLGQILAPSITSLSVNSANAGSGDVLIQVTGQDFLPGAVVRFNGNDKSSFILSDRAITATIPAADLITAGTFPVTVKNPDGSISNALDFTVN